MNRIKNILTMLLCTSIAASSPAFAMDGNQRAANLFKGCLQVITGTCFATFAAATGQKAIENITHIRCCQSIPTKLKLMALTGLIATGSCLFLKDGFKNINHNIPGGTPRQRLMNKTVLSFASILIGSLSSYIMFDQLQRELNWIAFPS